MDEVGLIDETEGDEEERCMSRDEEASNDRLTSLSLKSLLRQRATRRRKVSTARAKEMSRKRADARLIKCRQKPTCSRALRV
jgi:hypothetical protein